MSNLLGIDYGKSKIGLALAPKSLLAFQLKILPNDNNFLEELVQTVKGNKIDKIVVGLPFNMDGTKSKETKEAERFVQKLRGKFAELSIATYDERLSTVEAKKNLSGKYSRLRQGIWRGEADDAEAARIILQGYLDKRRKQL